MRHDHDLYYQIIGFQSAIILMKKENKTNFFLLNGSIIELKLSSSSGKIYMVVFF